MEKRKYELCLEILRRFHDAGILNNIILIGSWCLHFYEDYFAGLDFIPAIRTRDIDFLVPIPPQFKEKIDIPELLKDLGFVLTFSGSKGYIKLDHPELIVEFLVPERGRGSDKPYQLLKLGVNATPIRFLDFLVANTLNVRFEKMELKVPHPAAFALHKLIIQKRRRKKFKADKDLKQALMVIDFILRRKDDKKLKAVFSSVPNRWQKKILDNLKDSGEESITNLLRRV